MSERWDEIVRTPPVPSATWVVHPQNGWGAIVASRVGPGRTRPHHVPPELRRVTEICSQADGTTRRRTVAMSPEDLADIGESVNSYLADVGLPPAPFTWWEVAPPDGMAGEEFLKRLEVSCFERVTPPSGVEAAQKYATVLTEEIMTIFTEADATG